MKISTLIFIFSSKIFVTSSSKLPSTSNLSSKLEKAENLSFEKLYGGQSSSYSNINNLDVDNVKKTAVVAHNLSPSDILIALLSDIEVGLTNQIAENRRLIFGKNMLKENETKSILSLILEQFQDKLVQILLAVAVLSASLAAFEKEAHAFTEPIVIFSILLINALVGILQSKSAESSLEALKKLQPTTVKRKYYIFTAFILLSLKNSKFFLG
jgi:magnesium-transporting ATPase (P-type)